MGERERIQPGRRLPKTNQNGSSIICQRLSKKSGSSNKRSFYLRCIFPIYLLMFVYVFHQLRQSSIISFLGGGGQHEYGSSLPSRLSEFIMIKHTSKTTTTEAGEEPAETKLQLQQQNLDFLFSFQDDNEIITSKDDKWDETDAENKQHILKSKQQQAMDDKDGSPVEMEINTRYWERLRKRKDAYISEKATRQQRIERDLNMTKGWRPSSTETDFSNYPVLESQILPDMTTQKGGIIIFLHVPKVGGQTIRYGFDRQRHKRRHKYVSWMNENSNTAKKDTKNEFQHMIDNRVNYVTANWLDIFERKALPLIDVYLKREDNEGKVLFVEIHGMDSYNALELEPFIHYWRERAKESDVPFFTFTLLREAISAQVSFFNFYHVHPGDARFCKNNFVQKHLSVRCGGRGREYERSKIRDYVRKMKRISEHEAQTKKWEQHVQHDEKALIKKFFSTTAMQKPPPTGALNLTNSELEKYLVRLTYENPQCLFLARGELTFGDDPEKVPLRSNLKRTECQKLYLCLRRTMDWIGRTDTLSSETLPILTTMMFRDANIGKSLPRMNESPKEKGFIKMSALSPTALKLLEKKSQLDQELYHRAVQDYTLDQWVNDTSSF